MSWPAGVVNPLNIPSWRAGFPLRQWLRDRVPGIPVRVHNDALCVVAGETWCGAATGLRDVLGMVVSTGVGGGLVLDGRLRDGATGNAGHIGHIIAEPGGPVCGCGARGCLEAVARGPAIVAWAVERGWAAGDGRGARRRSRVKATRSRSRPSPGRVGGRRVVAGVAALLELDVVVIGGGLPAPVTCSSARSTENSPPTPSCTSRVTRQCGSRGSVRTRASSVRRRSSCRPTASGRATDPRRSAQVGKKQGDLLGDPFGALLREEVAGARDGHPRGAEMGGHASPVVEREQPVLLAPQHQSRWRRDADELARAGEHLHVYRAENAQHRLGAAAGAQRLDVVIELGRRLRPEQGRHPAPAAITPGRAAA